MPAKSEIDKILISDFSLKREDGYLAISVRPMYWFARSIFDQLKIEIKYGANTEDSLKEDLREILNAASLKNFENLRRCLLFPEKEDQLKRKIEKITPSLDIEIERSLSRVEMLWRMKEGVLRNKFAIGKSGDNTYSGVNLRTRLILPFCFAFKSHEECLIFLERIEGFDPMNAIEPKTFKDLGGTVRDKSVVKKEAVDFLAGDHSIAPSSEEQIEISTLEFGNKKSIGSKVDTSLKSLKFF